MKAESEGKSELRKALDGMEDERGKKAGKSELSRALDGASDEPGQLVIIDVTPERPKRKPAKRKGANRKPAKRKSVKGR